ncbi:MAG: prepilin-type N-terminal cleavage/methylation domain-containing protein [Opitutaceae bacterium]|jgi:prepilin-type N-terminal cleavage/methylation domain-containing protein/prepilin-type processing-associated H-X9-DG protein|nr:prepilin-type N-terminal cleavage/methylation domain-containing protein [Opitutaceae bacterium]
MHHATAATALLALFCALLFPASAAASATGNTPSGELAVLLDSDMETATHPPAWRWNVPAFPDDKNANATRVTDNPRSGKYCLRSGGGHLNWPLPKIRQGCALELRFWARGVSNGPSLDVMIRQFSPVDRVFFRTNAPLEDDWREYVYRIVMPRDIHEEASISIGQWTMARYFWIDDISLRELPAVEEGAPPTANPVRNPSFEAGLDGWTATFRKTEFAKPSENWSWHDSGNSIPAPSGARLEARESTPDAPSPHGKRHLAFTLPAQAQAIVTSAYFPARYGHKLRIAFKARSDTAASFRVGMGSGKNYAKTIQDQQVPGSSVWKEYSVPIILKPSSEGCYTVRFAFQNAGSWELDAVSVREDGANEAPPLIAGPSHAIHAGPGTPLAHLFDRDAAASFKLVVANEKPRATITRKITVLDYFDRPLAAPETVTLKTDPDGYGEATFNVPTKKYGAFKITATDTNAAAVTPAAAVTAVTVVARAHASPPPPSRSGPLPLAEQIYSVFPKIPAPAERPDSFFGSHCDLTPWNLEIARRAGFRWLRLYPPLTTQWLAVEREPGQWSFDTAPLAAARAQGFRIIGLFATAPDWKIDKDPQSLVRNRWARAWAPKSMAEWKEYVARAFEAFGPSVAAWEVWNEPDGGYLNVRPGVKKDDVMFSLIRSAREALEASGKPFTLLAAASADPDPDLSWKLLDRGAGGLLDGWSFHYYKLFSGGGSPDTDYALPILERYRARQNRLGETMPLWITECGYGVEGWLSTLRMPVSGSPSAIRGAALQVRAAMFFKAAGVKRLVNFYCAANESGRELQDDFCSAMIENTGIPGPGLAAHATMVALTEDAPAAGFEAPLVSGNERIFTARFGKTPLRGPVEVLWSVNPVPLATATQLKPGDTVLDLMGNPVSPEAATVGEFPLYIVRARLPPPPPPAVMKTTIPFPRSARSAFTLIELLTVITIIGILAAILIPTVSRIRESAHKATCLSNLRQQGLQWRLHVEDCKGRLPLAGGPNESLYGTGSYMDGMGWTLRFDRKNIYLCPSGRKLLPDENKNYSLNRDLNRHSDGTNTGYWTDVDSRTIESIRQPSRTALIADGNWGGEGINFFTSVWGNGRPPWAAHDGMANLVFVDGHVASMSTTDPLFAFTGKPVPGTPESIFYWGE